MRKVTLIRFGIAASLAAMGVVGAMAAGCSDDEGGGGGKDSGTDAPKTDTGPTPDTGTPDTGKPDATADADAAPPPTVKLIIVHAAPGFGDDGTPANVPGRAFRMCFATSVAGGAPVVSPLTALPDTQTDFQKANGLPPGIYSGTGGPLPQFPIDPSQIEITPFAIRADKIAGQTAADASQNNCADLIGSDGQGTGSAILAGKKDTDYFQLKTIPAGTFQLGNTYLLAFLGCNKGLDPAAIAKCGGDYTPAAGNLQVGIAKLDNKDPVLPADAGAGVTIGMQFAHRAAAVENLTGAPSKAANGVIVGYIGATVIPPPDAGGDADPDAAPSDAGPTIVPTVFPLLNTAVQYKADQIAPAGQAAVVTLPDNSATPFGVFIPSADGGPINPGQYNPLDPNSTGQRIVALPLSVIHQLSTGAPPGDACTLFVPGHSYTFVLVGDPTQAQLGLPDGGRNPSYDGRGVHIIAFPSDPVTPSL